jgi:hypothetical protein
MSLVEYKPPAKPKAATPLEFFEAVYMNPDLPLGTRLRAATEAAKYVRPRLEAIATYNHDGGFAEHLDRLRLARERSEKAKLVSAKPLEGSQPSARSPEEVSASAIGKAFSPLRRRI